MEHELATEETTVALWRLGRYTLREKIGAGGMGVVHRAVDGAGHEVAIKLLQPQVAEDAESRERFAREVRALSRVRGHHVAEVLEADIAASTPYLVTRYVAGASLQDVVANDGPLRGPALEALAADLVDALASIHEAGIVHRDLKPANVLVCGGEAYVIDFGIAQIGDDTRLTVPGMVFGTPGYLAPELLSGAEVAPGPAGDVFAWAATVAFAATGRPPFGAGRFDVVSYAVVHKAPDLDGVPGWLEPILRRGLAKDPTQRPAVTELESWSSAVTADPSEPGAGIEVDAARDPGDRVFDWATDASGDWSDDAAPFPAEAGAPAPPAVTARLPTVPPARPAPEEPAADARIADEPSAPAGEEHDPEPEPGRGRTDPVAAPWEAGQAIEPPGEKHPIVGALLLLALTAGAVVLPAAAGLVLLLWLVLARTVDRSSSFVGNRRALRGRRALDGLVAAGALPWHLVRSVGVTFLVLAVAAIGAGVLVGSAALFSYASGLALPVELVYAGTLFCVAVFGLRGFQHEPVQRGSRRILGKVVGAPEVGITMGLLLTVGIVTIVVFAVLGYVSYWPLPGLEPGPLVEAWRSLTTAG